MLDPRPLHEMFERYPILTLEGWGKGMRPEPLRTLTADGVRQFWLAAQFLALARRQPIRRSMTSYTWKHVATRWHRYYRNDEGNYYVCNGVFIAAALWLDFAYKPQAEVTGGSSPNVWLGISELETGHLKRRGRHLPRRNSKIWVGALPAKPNFPFSDQIP